MTYDQAKVIVEWAAQVQIGEVTKYSPHQVLTALAVMVLHVQDNPTDS
jgi:hypothetical protein